MERFLLCFGIAALLILSGVTVAMANFDKIPEKPDVVVNEPPLKNPPEPKKPGIDEIKPKEYKPDPKFTPKFREVVIVYFKEIPPSLEKFAAKYGGKLIFAKEDIKMAAFETNPIKKPGKTSKVTLDFIERVSKDPIVEKAFEDGFMFVKAGEVYKPEPKVVYPEDLEKQGIKKGEILNKVIVGFWKLPPSLDEFAAKHGGKLVEFNKADRALLTAYFETDNATEFIKSASKDPYVRSVAPDVAYRSLCYTPNDSQWSQQWGPKKIYAPEAWDYQKGSTDVVVAVLDTGIDYNHEDLAGRVIKGYDFVNNDNDPMDDNPYSHGTHVAGIIGAIMDNSKGIAGVAQVKILAVKVCDSEGVCTWKKIRDGVYYAADQGAKIISMSFRRFDYSLEGENACNYAYNTKGCLLIAASGNDGQEVTTYPAAFSTVIAVGAIDSNDQRASFSNYGSHLELVAPGVNILSTVRNNGYNTMSGTSMAVPHVSGVAALVWSQNPSFSNQKVREILRNTAVDLGSSGWDKYYGHGKVNAYAAVALGKILSSNSGYLSGSGNTYTFSVSIPARSHVTVVMAGNEDADFDLYAKWGSPPTTTDYDARGYSSTSLEYFTVEGSGALYVMVRSYSGSGYWKAWVVSGEPSANSGRNGGYLSGTGDSDTYSISGTGIGYAFNSGPDSSDFDLYIKWNSPPTTSSYDARGYSTWAQEIAGPATGSGTLYYMVRSYSGSGEYQALAMIY
ncbi:peptidase S8 and S53 subtilisin kexin sedolisin [Ferroglobus placidus DSM 10642]|uniref:Peptidase S8 and S53 subtilisin kexin sedolisin n=1 Tax=Ferroglobus placidus (strain DSM 10642 / AEDII12DO) TaxID=589924 RepID=D3S1V9_FERPA|nr:S8 family serine peptidase [Ferroglobus placidus]ADC64416.1 peptidase S8 and S53 subtilisin kexin sedolisin [Ferroglobus placidus DSM 10642]